MLNVTNYSSNGPLVTPHDLSTDQAPIATAGGSANLEDVYKDNIRNAKRPRVEYKGKPSPDGSKLSGCYDSQRNGAKSGCSKGLKLA